MFSFLNAFKNSGKVRQKNSGRAADIAAAGGVGLWEWHADAGRFWFSDYAHKLLQLGDVIPSLVEIQKRIYTQDQGAFLRAFTNAVATDQALEITLRLQMQPEKFRWLRWRGQMKQIGDEECLTGTVQDVHDEKLTQLELEFTQEMLNEAQKIARLGSWQYDIVSEHFFWSEETFNIFGRDIALGPPQGVAQYRYFDRDDFDAFKEKERAAIQSGHPYQSDLHGLRDDGHAIMVRIIGRPVFDHAGNPYLIVGTIQDITDWTDLQQAHARAEENQRTQSQFLASVSHEIRTPMNAIFGMAQLLLRANLPPQQTEQVRVVLTAARDLLAIINDLLDLARMESGHMAVESLPFDLLEMLREVTVLHGSKIYNKRLDFIVELAPLLPRMVEGDALRLKQVIGNLLSNAEKFTRHGQITLKVTIEGQAGPQTILRFTVTDSGVGIPPHRLASVFQKYVQAENSTAREYGGTGLGLAICRELVQLMGGEIHVTSDGQTGTRFWFDVPLHPIPNDVEPPTHARILLLEPSAIEAENLQAQLHAIGAQVVVISHVDNLLPALTSAAAQGGFTHVLIADNERYGANIIATAVRASMPTEMPGLILLALPITQTLTNDEFDAISLKPALPHELRRVLLAASKNPSEVDEKTASPRLRVLLAEDNRANQTALQHALEDLHCQVTVVSHGQQARDIAQKQRFSLIIMDLQMPVLDGLAATRELRNDWATENKPPVPILGLTGNAEAQNRAECLAAGMVDVLIKPVMLDKLREALENYAQHDT